ncbi:hypothetical protein QF004_002243 [Chryseobacterium sp. MDT2-18]|nr:hypothetical protein [Chryseobacterium sp. MDT2-18]
MLITAVNLLRSCLMQNLKINLSFSEKCEERTFAGEDLSDLSKAFFLAQKMGKRLGEGKVL